jgi:hypothetical protein
MNAAEQLDRAVREAIDSAPRLTDEQRERIAHLLRKSTTDSDENAA